MKFYTSTYDYDYSFPAVSLAYFLRYPNPYSTHVLSEDVIDRYYEPDTQRLHTTRLHLKQSKIPAWIIALLPKNTLGPNRGPNGEAQNFVLEKSVVDIRESWMETESQNLQYTGVLKVIEKQRFTRSLTETSLRSGLFSSRVQSESLTGNTSHSETTSVCTTVTFLSRLGQNKRKVETSTLDVGGEEPRKGLLSWSTAKLQGSIEGASLERARRSLVKSKEGMDVVLDRMREGGLAAVLDGMRKDRQLATGAAGTTSPSLPRKGDLTRWERVWEDGQGGDNNTDV